MKRGYNQPGYQEFVAAKQRKGGYHFNPITAWEIKNGGRVWLVDDRS